MDCSTTHDNRVPGTFATTWRVGAGATRLSLIKVLGISWVCACLTLCISPATAQTPLDPQAYDLSIAKGLIRFSSGQYSDAERLFQAALDANPGDSRASFYLGQTLIRLKRPEVAQEIFQKLLYKNQDDGRAWLGLGMAQYNRGQYTEALASLDNAEKHLPSDPLVFYYQGLTYHQKGAFDLSPGRFLRARTLSNDLAAPSHYYSGIAYFQRGLVDEAREEFNAVLAAGEQESELVKSARLFLEQSSGGEGARPKRWDLSLTAMSQFDNNVVLLPLGTSPPGGTSGISQKQDYRTSMFARAEYRPLQTETWLGGASYGVYQSFHSKLSGFDVEDHTPAVFLQRQFGSFQTRMQYTFDYIKVGRSPFLISHSIQPMFTLSEGYHAFTQIQFRYQNKDFQHGRFLSNSLRDGKNWLAGVTQYALFADNTGNFRLGYTFDTDRTGGGSPSFAVIGDQTNADWAYAGHRLSAGIGLPAVLTYKIDLDFNYYRQIYANPNSFAHGLAGDITTFKRQDHIYTFTGTMGRDFTEWLSASLQYAYTRDQSNVSSFDYNRSVYSLIITGRF
jgi:tetratricopeptide (TPR) repeat protein